MKTKCMKKGFTLLLGFLVFSGLSQIIYGQSRPDGSMPQFLFPEFTKGEVRMKKGEGKAALMNYNTVSEKMVFMQGEKIYEMTDIERIDTVTIMERKFVPVGKIFHEVILKGDISLFVQHKGDLMLPGKPAPYGGTSQTSSSSTVTSMEYDSRIVNLELPKDYSVNNKRVFWIRAKSGMSDFLGEKQFLKIFPENNADLKKYIKENKIRFERIQDVEKLVVFCNEKGIM